MQQFVVWQTLFFGWVKEHVRYAEEGASLVEYALLLALIAVVAIGALIFLGNSVNGTLNNVANNIAAHP